MSKEQYVTFEVARLLKEKGFDWEVRSLYGKYEDGIGFSSWSNNYNTKDDLVSAPTQQMACRWLREEKGLFIEIMCGEEEGNIWYDYDILPVGENVPLIPENYGVITYEEPEEAIEAALEYVLTKLI